MPMNQQPFYKKIGVIVPITSSRDSIGDRWISVKIKRGHISE